MKPVPQAIIAAAGSFLAVTLIFFLIALFCRVSKHLKRRSRTITRIQTRTTPNPNPSSVFDSVTFDPSLKRISLPDLVAATRNFSADGIIGDGSFGFVYKAQLPAGPTVAVKKLDRDAFQGFREFRAEVETLGKLKHENLVKILGYCISGVDRLIIYEFVEFGSLDHWLHDTLPPGTGPLTWPARVKIVRGVATGLEFLHTCEPRIIHRDIKASNVLLDADFVAHISDFGLARKVSDSLSHVSTQVAGTVGYMPPEYRDGMTSATVKADVYSFGVLMLEVGSGRRPNWPVGVEGGKEVGLTVWARKLFEEGRWMEVIDRTVEIKEEREVKEFVKIACLCTNERPKERPDMKEVVALFNAL